MSTVINARENWLVFVVIERIEAEILYFNELSAKKEPITKRIKKRAKKAAAEEQPAAPVAQTVPTGGYLWARDEEELAQRTSDILPHGR